MNLRSTCLISIVALAGCVGPPIGGDRRPKAPEEPAAEVWRRVVMDAPPGGYRIVPAIEKLDSKVRGDSQYWADRFFLPGASPLHQTGELKISAQQAKKTTPDLVRYEYRVANLGLTVVESANFTFVWVAGATLQPEESRPALIARIAASLFAVKGPLHDWQFVPVAIQGDDERYSTNAKTDAWDLRSWEDRADAGMRGGLVYFLFFKKNPERVGYERLERWFGDDFRKSLGFW